MEVDYWGNGVTPEETMPDKFIELHKKKVPVWINMALVCRLDLDESGGTHIDFIDAGLEEVVDESPGAVLRKMRMKK